MKKFLIGVTAFLVALVTITVIQYEKLGPTGGDILVTFTVKRKHENGDLGSSTAESSIKGKILLVRLTPVGDGMDAKIQTTEGWYEFSLDYVPIDWKQTDPVALTFQYKEGVQFREGIHLMVAETGFFLGFKLSGERIGSGGGFLPGDIERVALNRDAEDVHVSIGMTTKPIEMIARSSAFRRTVEIILSP